MTCIWFSTKTWWRVRNRTVDPYCAAYYCFVNAGRLCSAEGGYKLMHFTTLRNRLRLRTVAATTQSGSKPFLGIRRRSGLELAGSLLLISLMAIAGAILHDGLATTGGTKAATTGSPAIDSSTTAAGATSDTLSHASADGPADAGTANGNSTSDTTTNISITTNTTSRADGTTSTSSAVSVDGRPVTPPANGSTTHTYTSPDGRQTTVTATSSNNQSGSNNSGNHYSSNNLYLNSYTSSNNFKEVY